nr:Chain C, TAX(Y5F) peptide [synthetic construct]
LLFGFPVYV